MCLPNFMKFHHCLFKILKKLKGRGRMDGLTDGQMGDWWMGGRENSIAPT